MIDDSTPWAEQLAALEARQAEAARDGRAAEAAGRHVIYIHGRPYADPGADPAPAPESPWPWDLWNDGRPDEGQP